MTHRELLHHWINMHIDPDVPEAVKRHHGIYLLRKYGLYRDDDRYLYRMCKMIEIDLGIFVRDLDWKECGF
jgi:hypothetical protein